MAVERPDWEKALDEYGAEAVDLSQIANRTGQTWDERPVKELQQLAFDQMQQMERRMDAMDVLRVGDWYWITDQDGNLHLACDTVPYRVAKVMGMGEIQRIYEEAKRQEHAE